MTVKVNVPEAPAFLPTELLAKWKSAYVQGYERAQQDFPDDRSAQMQAALREANQLLRVPKITSYSEAKALPGWQLLKRSSPAEESKDGVLKGVTIDGRKFSFAVPAKKVKEEPEGGNQKSAAGGEQKSAKA